MTISTRRIDERVASVRFEERRLVVDLMDGRTIAVPLAFYPRLDRATDEQLADWQTSGSGYGIYWPSLDEDLSTSGLLRGAAATGR
jgi:hypothetical protein